LSSTRKPRIRAILSDWGRVVVDFDNTRTAKALVQHSCFGTSEELYRLQFVELRELFDAYMRGQLATTGYRKAMKRAMQLTCTDEAFDKAFADVFTPNRPIIDLWKRFRGLGVKMVAASNVDELRHARLIEMGVHDLFDRHCLSYQVCASKPHSEFFRKAWEMTYLDPPEILFVDDHDEFVVAARNQLMTGFTYDLKDHAAFERFLEGFEFAPYQLA